MEYGGDLNFYPWVNFEAYLDWPLIGQLCQAILRGPSDVFSPINVCECAHAKLEIINRTQTFVHLQYTRFHYCAFYAQHRVLKSQLE